ncbi:hypothetical protein VM1G_11919 [Cytospora mali]|uniref:Uncharacterized protein n=1 Tax=Cytospora mali TaxID=578113 RepID=A0A194WBT2_CYTMA|nr:hypothetical protein VM1G_11919 [Valsa mali]
MKILTISLLAHLASTALVVNAMAGIDDGITNHGVEGTFTSPIFPPKKTGGSLVSANAAISTSHAHQAGGPTAISGYVGEGTMAPHATAEFAVSGNWSGNVAINGTIHGTNGNVSMIQANYCQSR